MAMAPQITRQYVPTLRQLRWERTRASNRVKSTMKYMLTAELNANTTAKDGMPTWWPFWSDCLKDNVRDAIRAGRELETAERLVR